MQHDAGTLRTDPSARSGQAPSTGSGQASLTLATRRWTPHGRPKATVALVHGIGEHSGRYAHVATHLMLHDVAVHAFDLRGHGRSEGEPRAYVESFDEYVYDLDLFLDAVRREQRGPLFLYGHSLGGGIAARYVIEHGTDRLDGLILSSAALQIPSDLSPILQKLAGTVSRIKPTLPTKKLDTSHLSRDPAVVRGYEEDPLVYSGGVRARVGHEILRNTETIREHPRAFTLPLYLFHGTADQITDPAGSRWLYEHAPTSDKTLNLYEGFFHETHNEPGRERVLDDLTAWIEAHL